MIELVLIVKLASTVVGTIPVDQFRYNSDCVAAGVRLTDLAKKKMTGQYQPTYECRYVYEVQS